MGAASFTIQQPETILAPCSKCGKAIVVWEARALIEADRRNRKKKKLAQNRFQASPVDFMSYVNLVPIMVVMMTVVAVVAMPTIPVV